MLKHLLFALCTLLILICSVHSAPLYNGTFETDLSGWTVTPAATVEHHSFFGVAQFLEEVYSVGDEGNTVIIAGAGDPRTLSQFFDLSLGEQVLSFDLDILNGGAYETDHFDVLLFEADILGYKLDPLSPLEVYSWSNSMGNIDDTFSYGISSSFSRNVILEFIYTPDLDGQFDDTTVFLDNVELNAPVIPAPGAILLAGIGLGCFGYLRRRKTI